MEGRFLLLKVLFLTIVIVVQGQNDTNAQNMQNVKNDSIVQSVQINQNKSKNITGKSFHFHDEEDNACPKNFKCVPYKQCQNLNKKSVIYPCVISGQNLVCCPDENRPEPAVISKSQAFPAKCGNTILNDRIIGGTVPTLGELPFMALVGYTQKRVPFTQFMCGGSIITSRYVLTAAHCINLDSSFTLKTIRVGELNLTTEIDCEKLEPEYEVCADKYVDLDVEKTIPHPKFNTNSLKNDIALVKTKIAMTFTDYVQPICLPFEKKLQLKSLENERLEVSGWGKTSSSRVGGSTSLLMAKVKSWNVFQCNNAVPPEVQPIQNTQICANGANNEDACKGDSGGPLYNRTMDGTKLRIYQIGIVSFGATKACGNKELPTVYTRIDGYLKWIVENVDGN